MSHFLRVLCVKLHLLKYCLRTSDKVSHVWLQYPNIPCAMTIHEGPQLTIFVYCCCVSCFMIIQVEGSPLAQLFIAVVYYVSGGGSSHGMKD